MAYQKKNLTAAELSAIRAAAGKKGAASRIARGNSRGGRKPADDCDDDRPTYTTCRVGCVESSYLDTMSNEIGLSKSQCISLALFLFRRDYATFRADQCIESSMDDMEHLIVEAANNINSAHTRGE